MLNEKMINHTKLNQVTLDDLKATIQFNTGLADVIKWQLVGLYIKQDDLELEQLEAMFNVNGAFHNKRAYKTEAQYVFKALTDNLTIEGQKHKLSDIANMQLDDRPFSIGCAYKNRPKAAAAPKDERLAAAKRAIKDGEAGPVKNAKQLLDLVDMGVKEFEDILNNNKVKNNIDTISKEFPSMTTDNLDKIVTMTKEYLTDLYANHTPEFDQITDHILELQTAAAAPIKKAA